MKLLSLNCQSFSTAKHDLLNLVETYEIDILCLSETWEKNNEKLSFKNWKVLSRPRLTNNHGGVAICAKQSENFMIERLRNLERNDVEAVCVEIIPKNGEKFVLIVSYIPPNKTDELKSLLEMVNDAHKSYNNVVWTGDFNAKNKLWGNRVENSAGDILELYLRTNNSVILNDGLPTRRNCQSVIDLVLTTPSIVKKISACQTLCHENVRSDHIAILVHLDDNIVSDQQANTYKYQLQKTDWELWDTTTREQFNEWITEQSGDTSVDGMYQSFLDKFEQCVDDCVPQTKYNPNYRRKTPPWMDDNVKKKKNDLNVAKKHFKRRQTPQLLQELKTKEEEYTTSCTEAKSIWVEDTCRSIDSCSNPKEKWRAFHKLTTYEETDGGIVLPMLDENKTPIFDRTEKCKLLQKTFFTGEHLKTEEFDETFKNNVEEELRNLKQNHTNTQEDDFLNRDITIGEIEAAIQKLKNGKAAGPDQIYTDLIKKSNDTLLKAIKILFEASFATGQLPQMWKTAKVKFLQKPGKDNYYLPGSYRPISLNSVLGEMHGENHQ